MVGRQLLSVVMGIGLVIMIQIIQQEKSWHGPNSNLIRKQYYYDSNGKCFQLTPVPHVCPII